MRQWPWPTRQKRGSSRLPSETKAMSNRKREPFWLCLKALVSAKKTQFSWQSFSQQWRLRTRVFIARSRKIAGQISQIWRFGQQRWRRARKGGLLVEDKKMQPKKLLIITILSKYVQYLHLILCASFFYLLVGLIFRTVSPEEVANWGGPDMYLPIQALLFAGNFFTFTYLLQKYEAGLWAALSVWFYLFFRFGHFAWTLPVKIAVLAWTAIWFCLLVIKKRPHDQKRERAEGNL